MKFVEKVKKFQSGGSTLNDTWMFKPGEAQAAGMYSGSNSHNFLTPRYPEHVEDFDPETHGYEDNITASKSTFKYPDLNTSEGRRYATKMALRTASGEMPYERVPSQYKPFVEGLQNGWKTSRAIGDFGNKFAPILAGSFLAGPLMTYGIAAYSNPLVRTALDTIGSIDGIRNAFTDNGISKTIRLAKEGDTWGAVKSGIGDVFDIAGAGDLGGTLYRQFKRYGQLKNSYGEIMKLNTFDDAVNDAVRHYNTYVDPGFKKEYLYIQETPRVDEDGVIGAYTPTSRKIRISSKIPRASQAATIPHEIRHMNDPQINSSRIGSFVPDMPIPVYGETYARSPLSELDQKLLKSAYPKLYKVDIEEPPAVNTGLRSITEQAFTKVNGRLPSKAEWFNFVDNMSGNELSLYRGLAGYNNWIDRLNTQIFPDRVKNALFKVK